MLLEIVVSPAREQLARVERALDRIKRRGATDNDEDDLLCFFMHCWHLKDWIKHDATLPSSIAPRVEEDVNKRRSLRICADIANRTKHLTLTNKRLDAKIDRKYIEAYDGVERDATATYGVTLDDGSTVDAHSIAEEAVDDWKALFSAYNIS